MDEALAACMRVAQRGPGTILTHLGENLASDDQAGAVRDHYLELLGRIASSGLDTQVSVKPTQLGLDLSADLCIRNLLALVARAEATGNFVWIDMESSAYLDRTIELFRRARGQSSRVGLCLQAYLRRTMADLEAMLPLGPAIRLVKGAYLEPSSLAWPRKADTDENYLRLGRRLMAGDALKAGARFAIGTHDAALVERLKEVARANGIRTAAIEFEMLYGIQQALQDSLVRDGWPVRVLISYGEHWFPWYMRRLAERPANVTFVLKNLLTR